jgi:hypothetical protein
MFICSLPQLSHIQGVEIAGAALTETAFFWSASHL